MASCRLSCYRSFAIPFFNTVILVFSGLTLTLAHLNFLFQDNYSNNELTKTLNIIPLKETYHPYKILFFFFY